MPNVGILIIEDPSQVLDKKHQSRILGIVGWNLVWLSYNAFIEKYRTSGFDSFTCPEGVNPLLFSQLCVYHHSDTSGSSGLGISTQTMSQQQEQIEPPKINDLCDKKDQQNFDDATGHTGQVTIGPGKILFASPGILSSLCQGILPKFSLRQCACSSRQNIITCLWV